uniref:Sulfotransferase domain-containing protein n=1 Tax=Noctiluca scintillans TaxID=2966 RepID=A0A7S1AJB4_NOCSC
MAEVIRPSEDDIARARAAFPRISFDEFGFGVQDTTTRVAVAHWEANLRQDDVVVCSFPKSGTNWVKQIVHVIRLRGDPALVEKYSKVDLSELINIPEAIPDFDFSKVEELKPRAFFSHFPYEILPKGARYIYVMRNMPDATASLYKYVLGFPDNLPNHDVNDMAQLMMDGLLFYGRWESHLAGFLAQRENPSVLLVKYEDLKEDLAGEVDRIAKFMGFDLNEKEVGCVAEFSSFAYMKEHSDLIQGRSWARDHLKLETKETYTLVADGTSNKQGFSQEMKDAMQRHFRENAAPLFGMPELQSWADLKVREG